MHATIYVIIPADAPDPEGMVRTMLEPFRWRENRERQGAWYIWDYWYYFDPRSNRSVSF